MLFNKYNHLRKEKYFQNPLFEAKKKYACIGIGMHSLTNIYPILHHFNIPLIDICTKNTNWSKQAAKIFPQAIFLQEISTVINDKETEAVIICANPTSPYSLVSAFLAAGKKVFVEKPPCSTLAQFNNLLTIHKNAVCK